jgi:hypothetical protein
MTHDLISDDEYDSLPEDPERKFVAIERICRGSMNRMIDEHSHPEFDELIRAQYLMTVSSAATELGIDGLEYPGIPGSPAHGLNEFMLRANGTATRIRLRKPKLNDAHSVRLAAKTRGKIELQILKLRQMVVEADIPEPRKEALLKKLDELSMELSQPRLSFAKVFAILANVSVFVTTGTTFIAEAPQALLIINSLVGADKEAEEAESLRLGAPPVPKSLPAPASQALISPPAPTDDEIPF